MRHSDKLSPDAAVRAASRTAARLASYGAVLVLIGVTYLVSAIGPETGVTQAGVVVLQAATFLLALLAATPARWVALVGSGLAAFVVVIGVVGTSALPDAAGFTAALGVMLLGLALASILLQIIRANRSSAELVFGAIDAYLLLGLLFAFLFAGIGSQEGFFRGAGREIRNGDFLVFSYGNLTTLGGSNLVPDSTVVSTFAVLEAMLGQIFLVTVIARLVSLWAAPTPPPSSRA